MNKIYIQQIGHKIGCKIGHEIEPVLGHVSAARQGNGGEKGGEDVSPDPRGIVGGGPVGRGLWERRGDHSLLSDGTGTIEGCGAKAAVARETGERG